MDYFKGWAIPGTRPIDRSGEMGCDEGETLDALSGHTKIFQLRDGHRFSTDDLLVAWYGTQCASQVNRILDLGGGIGSVGMVAAWRLPAASVVAIEAQEASVRLSRKSLRWNGLDTRYEIRHSDFRNSDILKPEEKFELILGSPPYFPVGSGIQAKHPQKDACRFELRGDISDYCRIASAHLALGGVFSCVFPVNPEEQRERVENSARLSGLHIFRSREVILRAGEPPLLGVFAMIRTTDLPERARELHLKEPPLTIRLADGSISPEYSAIKLSIGFPP